MRASLNSTQHGWHPSIAPAGEQPLPVPADWSASSVSGADGAMSGNTPAGSGASGSGGSAPPPLRGRYRAGSLDHAEDDVVREREQAAPTPLRLRLVVIALSTLVLLVFAAAAVRVPETARGPGFVGRAALAQAANAHVDGIVKEVHVSAGQVVSAGDPIATLGTRDADEQAFEAEQALAYELDAPAKSSELQVASQEESQRLLASILANVERRLAARRNELTRLTALHTRYLKLSELQFVPADEVRHAAAQVDEARNAVLVLEAELLEVELRVRNLEERTIRERQQTLERAERARLRRDAVSHALATNVVRAPLSGVVEAVLARPGELLQFGAPAAEILSDAPVRSVFAFVDDFTHAALAAGSTARIEVDQLPAERFGTVRARVERIEAAPSTPAQIRSLLDGAGAKPRDLPLTQGAQYLVELSLQRDGVNAHVERFLRAGAPIHASYQLGSSSLLSLLLNAVWRLNGTL